MTAIKQKAQATFNIDQENARWRLQRPKSPWLISSIIVLAIGGLGGGFLLKLGSAQKTAAEPAHAPVLTVSTQTAAVKPIERQITVNGSISAWDPISIGPEASGLEIKSILVDDGSVVKKGQVLATLDASLLKPQLESEEARLKASIANAKKAVQPNRPEDINGLTAAVSQAKANLADQEAALTQARANMLNAKQNATRYSYLHKEGAVSSQELETRQTTANVADAVVTSAEEKIKAAKFLLTQANERLTMAVNGGRNEDIQIADANIAEIRGNIRRLQAQLAQTVIRAPVDGMITRRDAHLGDISVTGKSMFALARQNRLELKAAVPETDLAVVRAGQTAVIRTALTGEAGITGRVREISPQVDADTRLAIVRIDIPATANIKPGMYGEGHIDVGAYGALTVPAQAVVSEDNKAKVFVLVKDQVQSRTVTVGARVKDLVEIKSGLTEKDAVVVSGAGFLKDGDYVALAR